MRRGLSEHFQRSATPSRWAAQHIWAKTESLRVSLTFRKTTPLTPGRAMTPSRSSRETKEDFPEPRPPLSQ